MFFSSLFIVALAVVAGILPAAAFASEAPTTNIAGAAFTAPGQGSLIFNDSVSGIDTCTSSKGTGAFNSGSHSAGTLTLTLEGCKVWLFGSQVTCTTPGHISGQVVTSKLQFKLVYLDATHTAWGLYVSPPESGVVAEMDCGSGAEQITWKGSVLGRITKPAFNVSTSEATLVFEETGSYHQKYEQINGTGTAYHLTAKHWIMGSEQEAQMALRLTSTLKFWEPLTFLP
jgi:hypothetical protein